MRLCVFTTDLAAVPARRDALLQRAAELTGAREFQEVSFVGCRRSQSPGDGVTAYEPHVEPDRRSATRIANVIFRLVESKLAPVAIAPLGLALCTAQIIEVILACDPEVVLLDIRWGASLKAALEREFPGPI